MEIDEKDDDEEKESGKLIHEEQKVEKRKKNYNWETSTEEEDSCPNLFAEEAKYKYDPHLDLMPGVQDLIKFRTISELITEDQLPNEIRHYKWHD